MIAADRRATALAATGLLNCVVRELAEPVGDGSLLLPRSGVRMHVDGGRWPSTATVVGAHRPLSLEQLLTIAESELRARTGIHNDELRSEVAHSRDVIAAVLASRTASGADPYLTSEQALIAGHRYHPAAKARGFGPPSDWLPYAPEVRASFPLVLLGVRDDMLTGAGDTSILDELWGDRAPSGYRVLPAHPWQLRLIPKDVARPLILGTTAESAWATSSVRTVYLPEPDLSLKFSLDIRITNDVRRLWRHDLRSLTTVNDMVAKAFSDGPPTASMLAEHGYRTSRDGHEAFAVVVRDGTGPRPRPLLAAGLSEGFDGNPLDGLPIDRAARWWRRYVETVVPPALHTYLEHGVVLECHLQNVLVRLDDKGLPHRVLFRDIEGVKLVAVIGRDAGWRRLVYGLLVNNLIEIAGAVLERHPALSGELWPGARDVFARYGAHPEIRTLLAAPTVPAKTNLLLRWTGADGAASAYTPIANPLAVHQPSFGVR